MLDNILFYKYIEFFSIFSENFNWKITTGLIEILLNML